MALSDVQVRNAKAVAGKTLKLSDGGGLQLWITPSGSKLWNVAYRFGGKQKKFSIGLYPAVSLKVARETRDLIKAELAAGLDPSHQKRLKQSEQASEAAMTFSVMAAELIQKKQREGKSERTLSKMEWLFRLANPKLGDRPIARITAPEILAVLQIAEARGKLETAKRMRAVIGQVFRYAVATGRAELDPTFALRGAIATPVVQHRAALVEPGAFGELLRAIHGYKGAPETCLALKLSALTFVRPGELRSAEWQEFDLANCVWTIPAPKMKMRRPHKIPLAPQSMEILKTLQAMTGEGKFLFPSMRTPERCISENTLNAALRRMGFSQDQMTAHGFRAAASSMLNESALWHADAIERQLAHVDGDSVRRAYARAEFWEERVRMMTWWAEYLVSLEKADQMKNFETNI